jgi:hypothetical protein
MHRTVVAALVAALALALGSAGCGSGERTETVSSAQLAQRLKVACRAGERAGRRELRGTTSLALFLAQRASLRTIIDQIDHLDSTGRSKADLDEYKRTIRVRLDALERVASADRADQQQTLRAEIPTINAAGTRAHRLVLAISEQLRLICF